jgi:tripartite-type tricarboxylate transporter receptor subunit TctC
MTAFKSRSVAFLGLCVLSAAAAAAAVAQDFPLKPIRVVVPFPPGGGTDIVARIVLQKMGENLRTAFVVDNRGGAGGTIGTDLVAKAAGDGYTLGIVSGSHAINPSLYSKLPYDTLRDFSPITLLVSGPGVLVLHPSVPARSVKELIVLAKARPGQLNYASAGNGTPPHLAAELFKSMVGVDMLHVPYKGNSQAMADLVSGAVSVSFPTIPSALPHIRGGRLRALAVTSRERSRIAPEIATLAESGLPGYDASSWYGMVAPARTPAQIVQRLHQEALKAIESGDVRDKLVQQGLDPIASSPQAFDAKIREDLVKWEKVVRASGASIE